MDWILDEFQKEHGMDLRKQPMRCSGSKKRLRKPKSPSPVRSLRHQPAVHHSRCQRTQAYQHEADSRKMEQLCDDLFERTITPVKNCLRDAGISADKIDELVLVGGMTRMPKVVETAHSLVNKPPHQGVNPDEVVAWRRDSSGRAQG
jgi:molecular chaperone DnaK